VLKKLKDRIKKKYDLTYKLRTNGMNIFSKIKKELRII
jgi:hypothetical protein